MTFYLSLFIFILSVVGGLVLMLTGRGMSKDRFMLLTSIHLIFLLAFIASIIIKNEGNSANNYFFMVFICSGVTLSGLAWRSEAQKLLKIYFSLFILTIPLFLLSPSTLMNFLLTMNLNNAGGREFHLRNEYYIEEQKSTRSSDEVPHYKLILKKGMFHKTVQRDIVFGGKLDSLRVLENEDNKYMLIRGFTSRITFVSSETDSIDVKVMLQVFKQGDVEYHL